MEKDQKLNAKDAITSLILNSGITTWQDLLDFTKKLPYGRNSNRTDFSLVMIEKKGSCSSKHAFLKKVADLNSIPDVKLILGIYKMNEINTPKIGNVLSKNDISFIPEAHCYLKIETQRIDLTNENSDFKKLENDILKEIEISPEQVVDFKVNYHQEYLKNWFSENNIDYTFEEIWQLREQCIANLSN